MVTLEVSTVALAVEPIRLLGDSDFAAREIRIVVKDHGRQGKESANGGAAEAHAASETQEEAADEWARRQCHLRAGRHTLAGGATVLAAAGSAAVGKVAPTAARESAVRKYAVEIEEPAGTEASVSGRHAARLEVAAARGWSDAGRDGAD